MLNSHLALIQVPAAAAASGAAANGQGDAPAAQLPPAATPPKAASAVAKPRAYIAGSTVEAEQGPGSWLFLDIGEVAPLMGVTPAPTAVPTVAPTPSPTGAPVR
jgi:hypothetical protein